MKLASKRRFKKRKKRCMKVKGKRVIRLVLKLILSSWNILDGKHLHNVSALLCFSFYTVSRTEPKAKADNTLWFYTLLPFGVCNDECCLPSILLPLQKCQMFSFRLNECFLWNNCDSFSRKSIVPAFSNKNLAWICNS